MSQSLEELKPFLAKDAEDRKAARIFQLRAKIEAAQKVSELVADPRWELWGRHIEAMRDAHQVQASSARWRLCAKFLQGEEYLKVKIVQVEEDAAVKALNQALLVAKTLIEQGEKAAEELKTVDKVQESA